MPGMESVALGIWIKVGGRYEFSFTKEVVRSAKGFVFQHRKFVSAKYPWKNETISFAD
jgi:hypothetical protein